MWVESIGVPEGVPAAGLAEIESPKMADGIRAGLAPAHAASLQPVAHDRFAGRFHRARADLPPVADIGGVVHPVLVVAEVLNLLAMDFSNGWRGVFQVQLFQPSTYGRTAFVFQAMARIVEPRLPRGLVVAVQGLGQFHQVFLRVIKVEDAHRVGKEPLEKRFQARPAVGQRDLLIRLGPTDLQRLAVQLPTEGVQVEKTR